MEINPRVVAQKMKELEDEAMLMTQQAFKFRDMAQKAYHERNQLVALLARMFPSGLARTQIEGWDPEWENCVYINLPTGQVSWHYHDREAELFEGLPPYRSIWDGHSSQLKYQRIREFASRICCPANLH